MPFMDQPTRVTNRKEQALFDQGFWGSLFGNMRKQAVQEAEEYKQAQQPAQIVDYPEQVSTPGQVAATTGAGTTGKGGGLGGGSTKSIPGSYKTMSPFKGNNEQIKELEALLKKYESKTQGFDLSPLVALVDSWTGSKLLAGYARPQSDDQRQMGIFGVRQQISRLKTDYDYKRNRLNIQIGEANNKAKQRQEKINLQLKRIGETQGYRAKNEATKAFKLENSLEKEAFRLHRKAIWEIGAIKSQTSFDNPEAQALEGTIHQEIVDTVDHLKANDPRLANTPTKELYAMVLEDMKENAQPAGQ